MVALNSIIIVLLVLAVVLAAPADSVANKARSASDALFGGSPCERSGLSTYNSRLLVATLITILRLLCFIPFIFSFYH